MDSKQAFDQLAEIKKMMNRSSRFMSLSGLSGVLAGVYALIGSALVYFNIRHFMYDYRWMNSTFFELLGIALGVLILSVITGVVLSKRKAKKRNETVWNDLSKQFLFQFLTPMITGGLVCMFLLQEGYFYLVSPMTLIFYGLALVSAGRFTIETIRSLGILFILLGMANLALPGYGLYFWSFGFGVCHIIYGTFMYFKYDRGN